MRNPNTRRSFLKNVGLSAIAAGMSRPMQSQQKPIQGFERAPAGPDVSKGWEPVSSRKLRVGLVGYGVCRFAADFSFQHHPNVEIVAPGPGFWPLFRGLLLGSGTAGNLTSDAYLAALAIERGATLYSTDHDFQRFAGLLYVNPLAEP